MARESVNKYLDRKVFRNTASSHKTINLSRPGTFRGGIRL